VGFFLAAGILLSGFLPAGMFCGCIIYLCVPDASTIETPIVDDRFRETWSVESRLTK
jgi:hypothetical protein